MTDSRHNLAKGLAFLSPWLLGLLIFTIIPITLSFYYSFCDYSLLKPPLWIGLDNYRGLVHDPVFWRSLWNTGYYALFALPGGLCVSVGLALLLNQNIKGQAAYRTIIYIPSLVPVVASSMLWLWLFNAKLGLINGILARLGSLFAHAITLALFILALCLVHLASIALIRPRSIRGRIAVLFTELAGWVFALSLISIRVPALVSARSKYEAFYNWLFVDLHFDRIQIVGPAWLDSQSWAMPSLILMSLWGVGNSVVIYLAGLQDVPRELYEAADIDGANGWQRLWNVTLPMISPVIFFNLIMGIIGSLQVFATAYIMTGGGPARATYFYTMYLYDNAFNYLKMGYASAMAWIQLLIVLMLTAIAFWSSRRWVHYQGK